MHDVRRLRRRLPLLISTLTEILDMRRGMIDEGNVPQDVAKASESLESSGNPYGKMRRRDPTGPGQGVPARGAPWSILDSKTTADTLYFVDSVTSYDDRIQR